jgi:hypothetical protein
MEFRDAYDSLFDEAERLHEGDREFVISTNIPLGRDARPLVKASEHLGDPGVAVYVWKDGRPYAIASDGYLEVRHNLCAVRDTLRAFRTIARHRASSLARQMMSGFSREIGEGERAPEPRRLAAGSR